jgi:carboxypeptidase C (cathepsin A)
MFYWFFESRSNPDKDPLLIWLNGGPGCSSLIALFFENGPFEIKNDGDTKATLRSIAWNQKANVIFLE